MKDSRIIMNQKQILIVVFLSSIMMLFFSCGTQLNLKQNLNQNKDSVKVGVWIVAVDSSDMIRLETYRNGLLSGSYFEYYKNGVLATKGKYRHGQRVGWWLFTGSLNHTIAKQKYKKGEIQKSIVYPPIF